MNETILKILNKLMGKKSKVEVELEDIKIGADKFKVKVEGKLKLSLAPLEE